ncbi:MAG TPA: hypothetical protein VER98_02960, partial [Terriglobia bacterium]|nr:hypothetical protein [Terriglobia bacterium]
TMPSGVTFTETTLDELLPPQPLTSTAQATNNPRKVFRLPHFVLTSSPTITRRATGLPSPLLIPPNEVFLLHSKN